MTSELSRRELITRALPAGALAVGAVGSAAATLPRAAGGAEPDKARERFLLGLNTSTIREHKLPITEIIDLIAAAGYRGIEPWPQDIDRHLESGGTLKDLDQRLKDRGVKVIGAIAFFEWMVDDEARRKKALEDARRRLDQLAQIGASHIAAPPAGDVEKVDLLRAAERYRAFLEAAAPSGVIPAVEVWGFAKNCYRLGQCVYVALESGHPQACVLPDVYHLYKGGSGLGGIRLLNPAMIAGFHLNDYPASPPRETIRDADRVYPGDGVAPLKQFIRDLHGIGYQGSLSIELFNPEYYKQDAKTVVKTAIDKARRVIGDALVA
jgi:sugar phosphate isomerase/epimerase